MQKNLLLAQAKNQKVWSQKLAILLNQIECKWLDFFQWSMTKYSYLFTGLKNAIKVLKKAKKSLLSSALPPLPWL